jgi:VWFA-related protein
VNIRHAGSVSIRAALRIGACLLMAAGAATQEPGRITARVEVVNVDVTVTDGRGNFVRGLTRERFRVLDNGAEQPITHFASIEAPGVVLVLVETSPAVFLLHRQHLDSAYALLGGLAPDDQVALASYDESARLLLPFSTEKRALAVALGGLRYNLGRAEMRFCDAVSSALDWLAPIPGKKALVLLATGLDTSGPAGCQKLENRLATSEATIYAIALGGELRDFREGSTAEAGPSGQPQANATGAGAPLSFAEADRALRAMTERTGGAVFFPRKAEELEGIYRTIAATLRHRYSLGYALPARDGQFHRIHVQLRDERGRILGPWYPELETQDGAETKGAPGRATTRVRYRIFTRFGYTAPPPAADSPDS